MHSYAIFWPLFILILCPILISLFNERMSTLTKRTHTAQTPVTSRHNDRLNDGELQESLVPKHQIEFLFSSGYDKNIWITRFSSTYQTLQLLVGRRVQQELVFEMYSSAICWPLLLLDLLGCPSWSVTSRPHAPVAEKVTERFASLQAPKLGPV